MQTVSPPPGGGGEVFPQHLTALGEQVSRPSGPIRHGTGMAFPRENASTV